MYKSLQRLFTARNLAIFLAIVFFLSLVPMLMLSFYSYPAADDFGSGASVRRTVLAGGSLFDVLRAAYAAAKTYYHSWQGTYFSTFLFALQPGAFGTEYYFLTTWIMLLLLITSTMRMIFVIVRVCLQKPRAYAWILSMAVLFVSIQLIPNGSEAFYWYNGAVYYICPYALQLFYFAELFCFLKDGKHWRIVPMALLSILIGGGNYVTALLTAELSALSLVLIAWKKRERLLPLLILTGLFFAGFAANMLAPGNAVRAAANDGNSVIMTLYKSIGSAVSQSSEFLTLLFVLAVLLLMPVLYHLVRDCRFTFPVPGIVCILSLLVFASQYAPTWYAMDQIGDPRIENIRYFLFILLLLFCTAYTIGWLVHKLREISLAERIDALIRGLRLRYGFLYAATLLCLMLCSIAFSPGKRYMPTTGAIRSLMNGEAQAFHAEHMAREAILTSDKPIVTVPPMKTKPYLLYIIDMQPGDGSDWVNQGYAGFFGKERVLLSEE